MRNIHDVSTNVQQDTAELCLSVISALSACGLCVTLTHKEMFIMSRQQSAVRLIIVKVVTTNNVS